MTYLPELVFQLVRHKPAPTPVFFLSFVIEDELTPELYQLKRIFHNRRSYHPQIDLISSGSWETPVQFCLHLSMASTKWQQAGLLASVLEH